MGTITLDRDQEFNLDTTLSCGQVFRWTKVGAWWCGVVGDRVLKIRQDGQTLTFTGASPSFVRSYFQLDADLAAIVRSFDRDPFIHTATERCRGLRIIRQPAWECTISYLCATNSNIPMVRQRIEGLARQFGRELTFEGTSYFGFPRPHVLTSACATTLAVCKLGYRAAYLSETTSTLAAARGWEEKIRMLPYAEARGVLMSLRGIGPKAADCILLFAFQKYEAFPVDVWIRRIMSGHYAIPRDVKSEYERISRFARAYFGPFAGYAQEYLYCARK